MRGRTYLLQFDRSIQPLITINCVNVINFLPYLYFHLITFEQGQANEFEQLMIQTTFHCRPIRILFKVSFR